MLDKPPQHDILSTQLITGRTMKYDLQQYREVSIKKTRYFVSPEGTTVEGLRLVLHEVRGRDGNKRLVRVIGNVPEALAAAGMQ